MAEADPALVGAILFTGFQPRETVIALRFAAAVNLVPMGGFSLIEACASGRPVVAYNVEWHAELVEDGRSGLLVDAEDCVGLAAAVASLLDNPGRSNSMGAAARERAFALHNIENVYRARSAVYRDILASERSV
jgi:glycosyltransferase involved in cell wall biosynthesis